MNLLFKKFSCIDTAYILSHIEDPCFVLAAIGKATYKNPAQPIRSAAWQKPSPCPTHFPQKYMVDNSISNSVSL